MNKDKTCDIGVIGLAVMGQNLVLNMADKGYTVAAYNRTTSVVDKFLQGEAGGRSIVGAHSLQKFIDNLAYPRKVLLMVRAGDAVDSTIDQLLPLLEQGDIVIDGGNSNFEDSTRRTRQLKDKGILFLGTGISGGEEGARNGPSIMCGGNPDAWPQVKSILQAISAKVPSTEEGIEDPCCDWVGREGAGHFVKMVHNGIEYGDMQLICEAYHFMKSVLQLSNSEMQAVISEWNSGDLDSYLIEITADILGAWDEEGYVLDRILDSAGQKGTGKWASIHAMNLGIPLTLIGEAVFSRFLSTLVEERTVASTALSGPTNNALSITDKEMLLAALKDGLFASKIVSYAQGYMLMQAASEEYDWELNYASIAQLWRGGCIIRSVFLKDIYTAYQRDPTLTNILMDDYFKSKVSESQDGWRAVVSKGIECGVPMPAMSSAIAFYDGYRCQRLPANLLQAQRDYFGAHTYERIDKSRGERFHTEWNQLSKDGNNLSKDS